MQTSSAGCPRLQELALTSCHNLPAAGALLESSALPTCAQGVLHTLCAYDMHHGQLSDTLMSRRDMQ